MTIQSTSTQPHGRQSSVMIHDNYINKLNAEMQYVLYYV